MWGLGGYRSCIFLSIHLKCFYILTIIGNAAMNMAAQICSQYPTFNSLGMYTEMGLLECIVVTFLIFRRTFILFCTVPEPLYIPTKDVQGFQLLHILARTFWCFLACFIFWSSFEFTIKFKGRCRDFPYALCLHSCQPLHYQHSQLAW
jgi:hypothetical protein